MEPTSEISTSGLNDLQATFSELRGDLSLLTSGKIRDEILRVIGQIKKEYPNCSADILHLPSFEAKMQVVYEMYQCLKGKRKAEQEPPSVEPVTGGQIGVSEATAATPIARVPPSVATTYESPAVYML